MKSIIRTLFVWLLLCAVPFQGYAAARMASGIGMAACPHMASATQATVMPGYAMHHRVGTGINAHGHGGMGDAPTVAHAIEKPPCHGGKLTTAHADNKCGSMGGCCIAAGLPPPAPLIIAAVRVPAAYLPFLDRFVPDTLPRTLERPPRALLV